MCWPLGLFFVIDEKNIYFSSAGCNTCVFYVIDILTVRVCYVYVYISGVSVTQGLLCTGRLRYLGVTVNVQAAFVTRVLLCTGRLRYSGVAVYRSPAIRNDWSGTFSCMSPRASPAWLWPPHRCDFISNKIRQLLATHKAVHNSAQVNCWSQIIENHSNYRTSCLFA